MDTLFRKSRSSRTSGSTAQPPNSAGIGGVPYNQLPQSNGLPVAGPSSHSLRRDVNGYENLKDMISPPNTNAGLGRNGPPVPGKDRSSAQSSSSTLAESSRRPPSDASAYNGSRLVSPLPSADYRNTYTTSRDPETASIRSVSTVNSVQQRNKDLGRYPAFSVDASNQPIRPIQQAFSPVPGLGPSSSSTDQVNMTRPPDEKVEELFQRLVESRDTGSMSNIPTLSSRASVATASSAVGAVSSLSADMKWKLVEANFQTQSAGAREAKRKEEDAARSGKTRGEAVIVKNTAEWYLRKLMTRNFTKDHFNKLGVSLRTEPVE